MQNYPSRHGENRGRREMDNPRFLETELALVSWFLKDGF
jgi:hypothetical protein